MADISIDHLAAAVRDGQEKLPLWLSHIWQRLHEHRRLGLILGAGVSIDAGCPLWHVLIQRLANNLPDAIASLKLHRDAGISETYITQILYHLHKAKISDSKTQVPANLARFQVDSTWMEAVYTELYKDLNGKTFEQIADDHPYLRSLGELAARAGLTVNFNFDDLVDEAAIEYTESLHEGPPEIISKPKLETRRNAPVIYHINGLLPREKLRRRSSFLTFTEDAFAEILISPHSFESEYITSRFGTTTFLLLGTSLNDNSLKNMLRAGLKRNSANHHYIIFWENPEKPRSQEERKQIFEVNLEVYNLISIFLTAAAISEFINVLNEPDASSFEGSVLRLASKAEINFTTRRRYYLAGSVAAGKSSNLEALRCFTTFEEWSGRTPQTLYQDHNSLLPDERSKIDDWLMGQLRIKNDRMRAAGPGVHIMDRSYLDLFVFSKEDAENVEKASQLRLKVRDVTGPLERGQILLLKADEESLSARQASRGKLKASSSTIDYDGKKLIVQGDALEKIYQPEACAVFDTSKETCEITARKIARLILLGEYQPFDFEKRIDEIASNGGSP